MAYERAASPANVPQIIPDAELTCRPNRLPPGATHTVAPRDTLWDLAEQYLGDGGRWPELYENNEGTIGADPDLILPGQQLVLPDRPDLDGSMCMEPEQDPAQDMCTEDAPAPLEPMQLEDYLEAVAEIEAFYKKQAKDNGAPYDNSTSIAGLRAMYGYEGGFWEYMIPDAPQVEAPETLGAMDRLRPVGADGKRTSRLVLLPDGSTIDPGHLFTGIDAQLHPDANFSIDGYGIDNRDASTWSGDVGSAITEYKGNVTADKAWEDNSGSADLIADLDGVNLGAGWDVKGGVAEQLRAYYDPEKGGAKNRFGSFLDNRGLKHQDGLLSEEAIELIRAETDDFAEAYDRRKENFGTKAVGVFGRRFDENDTRSTEMTNRFIRFLEGGLAGEQGGVCTSE